MDRRAFPASSSGRGRGRGGSGSGSGSFFSTGRLMDTWIFFLFVAIAGAQYTIVYIGTFWLYRWISTRIQSSTYQNEARSTDEDVCGKALREKRHSKSLEILKDYGDDLEHSDIDIVLARQSVASDKTEIEIESIDGHVFRGGMSESAVEAKFEHPVIPSIIDHIEHNDKHGASKSFLERNVDVRETTDDAFEFNLENEVGAVVGEAEAIDYETTTTWIGLENSSEICRCVDELESDQTPSPDPLKEFLKRMRVEVEAGRLETIFRVSGIGPSMSPERVTAVGLWLADCARRQEGLVGPRNIRHFLCPNLDDILECNCT